MMSQEIDLAVIGGGPAGLAAAIKAKESGLGKVTIIERGSTWEAFWTNVSIMVLVFFTLMRISRAPNTRKGLLRRPRTLGWSHC